MGFLTVYEKLQGIVTDLSNAIQGAETAVWDADPADHTAVDTFGNFIQNLGGGGNPRITGEYVADGNISKGDFVGITSEGKAKTFIVPAEITPSVEEVVDAITIVDKRPVVVEPSASTRIILYVVGSDLYSVYGTFTYGSGWSWGTPEDTTINIGNFLTYEADAIDANTIVVAYGESSVNYGYAVIISYAAGAISAVGSPSEFYHAAMSYISVIALNSSTIIVAGAKDGSSVMRMSAGSISGTTITGWSASPIDISNCAIVGLKRVSDSTFLFAGLVSSAGTLRSYSVSGTTITHVTSVALSGAPNNLYNIPPCIFFTNDTEDVLAVAYRTGTNAVVDVFEYPLVDNNKLVTVVTDAFLGTVWAHRTSENKAVVFTVISNTEVCSMYEITFTDAVTNPTSTLAGTLALTSFNPKNISMGRRDGLVFFIAARDDDADLSICCGAILNGSFFEFFPEFDGDGFLGIAEEAISDGATGTICTFGVPTTQTKTGMNVTKGWYSTGLTACPLAERTRDGNTGLVAFPLTGNDLKLQPEQIGDTSWI